MRQIAKYKLKSKYQAINCEFVKKILVTDRIVIDYITDSKHSTNTYFGQDASGHYTVEYGESGQKNRDVSVGGGHVSQRSSSSSEFSEPISITHSVDQVVYGLIVWGIEKTSDSSVIIVNSKDLGLSPYSSPEEALLDCQLQKIKEAYRLRLNYDELKCQSSSSVKGFIFSIYFI